LFVPTENFIEKATNAGSELRRYYDETHFEAYLKEMKDRNEKVSIIFKIIPNHKIQKLDQWLGIMSHFFEEYLLIF
jgi:hypothetical protein